MRRFLAGLLAGAALAVAGLYGLVWLDEHQPGCVWEYRWDPRKGGCRDAQP